MQQKAFEELLQQFKNEISECHDIPSVLNLKAKYLGKQGLLSEISGNMREMSVEEKKKVGQALNLFKNEIDVLINQKMEAIENTEILKKLTENPVDFTLRRQNSVSHDGRQGAYHPVTLMQREIEDIFLSMGFLILDGPHVENDYHNFQALNIPSDHPARDMQDTFWFADGVHLLRTHTSTVQVRGMQSMKPPFKFLAPGKVFRSERTDASHEFVFHQLEGMLVDKDISVANLIYFMKTLLSEIFKREVEVRLRPGYFPFVEPGFELDMRCLICSGKGCSVCKHLGWVEVLPCGMIHPNVLKHGNIDSKEFTGFAFGLGLDRLVMMKYAINDIRTIHSGDVRFSRQFSIE